MMTKQAKEPRAKKGGGRLLALVEAIRRRFRGQRGELEREGHRAPELAPKEDPVAEAGVESFPASDPPSFTPEKST